MFSPEVQEALSCGKTSQILQLKNPRHSFQKTYLIRNSHPFPPHSEQVQLFEPELICDQIEFEDQTKSVEILC
jgi:hypothetical protein